ncbi:hypothetical protein AB0I28_37465 [Phytomonospora sp. NPDC050363]|uniref:SCO4848 family membrane protein n=1 Tax=Phytomonospora sp. NPDC050363 TaxID=3155642 RepID=UPI0033E9BEF1
MKLSRRWSVFLLLVALWNWVIWPRFALAIWNDERSWDGSAPTSFLYVHAVLIIGSLVLASTIGWLGVKGLRRR